MRIGSRVIPLPAIAAAAAGLIAIIVVAVVVVVSGGGDDDDDGGGETVNADRTAAANRTSVSQSRTRIPLTSTAIAEARETAIAEGTPEDAFDAANPTPVPPTAVVGEPDTGGPGVTPGPGTEVPPATQLPGETATAAPTATALPPGVIGDITLDGNTGTSEVDHAEVTAGVGGTVEVAIVIDDALGGYNGYEYALMWEDNGTLSFGDEQRTPPQGYDLCTEASDVSDHSEPVFIFYGGCLRTEGTASSTGVVAVIALRCDAAGRTHVSLAPSGPSVAFGTSLLAPGGGKIATEVDNGFDVVCA
jgi:hypothetical protein